MGLLAKVKKGEFKDKPIPEIPSEDLRAVKSEKTRLDLKTGKIMIPKEEEEKANKAMEKKISEKKEKFRESGKGELAFAEEAEKKHSKINLSDIKKEVEEELKDKDPKRKIKIKKGKIDLSDIKKEVEEELKETRERQTIISPDRVPSGIPGLDETMEGGLRKNTVNLIGGGAGSGKSIICMQYLIKGIEEHNEPGIYISFEQNPARILNDFERFGWNLNEKISQNKLRILYYTPEQVSRVLEAGGGAIRDLIEQIGVKRIVIDSLTAFTLLHESELQKRRALLKLIESIQKWGCTAVLTSEQEPDPEKHHSTIMEFEVDGIILLYNLRKGDVRERSLEVFKMRATQHAQKILPMNISDDGITIYPEETVF